MTQNPGKKLRVIPLLIFFLLFTSFACSFLPGAPLAGPKAKGSPTETMAANRGATPGGAVQANAPTSVPPGPGKLTPTAAQSQDISVKQAINFGPGSFDLPDPKVGLAGLPSYTATLTTTFEGTVNGKPVKWSRTYVMLTSKDPAVRQLTIQTSGDVANVDPVFMAELDGADYERRGTNDCTAAAIDPQQTLGDRLEPAGFLNFVIGADEAGSQTANNVPAKHYTFDERALGQEHLTQSTGELWVASDGGYLVSYKLSSNESADYLGQGMTGVLVQDYELTDVGKPVTVQLPAECPGGMVNAPMLPDASNVENNPGLLSYDTATSLADAIAFYQKQIPGLGWKLKNEAEITQTDAAVDFQQGDQTMSIFITTDAGVTTVNISLDRGQQ